MLYKINERFVQLRKMLGLTQAQIGEMLNLTRSAISNYEYRKAELPDRTISDICRVFSINEEWLRFGTGEIYRSSNNIDEELSALVEQTIKTDDIAIKQLIVSILKLPDDERALLKKLAKSLANIDQ